MQSRVEPTAGLDDFPTPLWATRAFVRHVLMKFSLYDKDDTVLEPAANRGFMARALSEYFDRVRCSDIHDYGCGFPVEDFTAQVVTLSYPRVDAVDWIITNPPFKLAPDFSVVGSAIARKGVALLTRTSFLEGKNRYENLFSVNRPAIIAQYVERVPMFRGRLGGKKETTATSYCWIVWSPLLHYEHPVTIWIPPCRKVLERDADYSLMEDWKNGKNE